MDPRSQAGGIPNYQDFDPKVETVNEKERQILLLLLPDFTKETLKVQLTPDGKLNIHGQRQPDGEKQWRRFNKQFQVPDDCEASQIAATFENGVLFVLLPKKAPLPTKPQPPPDSQPPRPPQKGDGEAPAPTPAPALSSALRERPAAEDQGKSSTNVNAKGPEKAAGEKSRPPPAVKEQGNWREWLKVMMTVLLGVLVGALFVKKNYFGFFQEPKNQ